MLMTARERSARAGRRCQGRGVDAAMAAEKRRAQTWQRPNCDRPTTSKQFTFPPRQQRKLFMHGLLVARNTRASIQSEKYASSQVRSFSGVSWTGSVTYSNARFCNIIACCRRSDAGTRAAKLSCAVVANLCGVRSRAPDLRAPGRILPCTPRRKKENRRFLKLELSMWAASQGAKFESLN